MERVPVAVLLTLLCHLAAGLQCRVDDTIDWEDPNNLYTCKDDKKCCTEDAKPSCCGEMEQEEEIMRQVKLWCGVIGVIVLFGLLMWYARWDGQCCDEDTKCCCCRSKAKPVTKQRTQNMGRPPGFGGENPKKSESARDLLTHENETY
ncbi:uncharacterized protein LOC119108977 [Pollicipes pollicipes]|uniref:uncharacterized protein LOC119108959 n=1 Tax=Pollicipes pollicipes TaxID=41117 RepID=UPI0018857C12|nr:uncharacterized protein LOC119108959 [Pollicipes pollicipes]XP_037088412.1 uncharacterized protein LOC119108972 [Pollicipes pollicipes]XP_037088419.1 uncharacterized protein LOC119108977 [Pollicipes pollicipes]